jgi:hypothetical protein
MPARDTYYQVVKNALVKDGWTITHDPFRLSWGGKDLYADLGAERLLAADKGGQRIAVEIKSFTGPSQMTDLERAIGQYAIYHAILKEREPGRQLYLAVPLDILRDLFEEPFGQLVLKNQLAQVFGFDPQTEEIVRWLSWTATGT